MGKIKKILEKELGSTQSVEVYPVTSIEAVYDENNERLDNIINRKNKEIHKELEAEVERASNAESNLRETINNITEINENATSANIVTIDTIPNTSSSNVQQALNELFKNATFAGIATPTTNPGTPDGPVFYIATTAGNYSNFGNIEISKGETAILKWNNGTYTKNAIKPMTDFNSVFDAEGRSLKEQLDTLGSDISKLGLKIGKVEAETDALSLYDKIFDTTNNKIEYSNVNSTIKGTCDIKKGSFVYVKFSGFKFNSAGQLVIKLGNDYVIPATTEESGENFYVLTEDATSYTIYVAGILSTAIGGNVKILSKSYPEFLNDILSNKKEIDNLNNRLSIINLLYGEYKSYSISPRGYYYTKNGEQKYASSTWGTSGFIKVSRGSKISYKINTMPSDAVSFIGYKIGTEYVDLTSSSQGEFVAEYDSQLQVTSLIRETDPTDYYLKVSVFNEQKSVYGTFDKNVNWVGMSIWEYDGHEISDGIQRGYQTLLNEVFKFTSHTGTSYCYSGNSLGALTEGDTSCILNKRDTWLPSQNALWTLDSITNDFKRNIPIGTKADYDNNNGLLTFYGALRIFKDKVLELSGDNAIVVCANALKRNNGGYTSTSTNTVGHTLADYEMAMLTIAHENGWYFVDQNRMSGITDENLFATTIDGLHLNSFGYSLAVLPWITTFQMIKGRIVK